ncbi:MAG: hypothetical protein JO294_03770 [Alphaproteobacteria bacterium]|nr:hypothetical protein [Alphaproteobacteria bacterium]
MSGNYSWVISGIERTTDHLHKVTAIHWRYQLKHGDTVLEEVGEHRMPPAARMTSDGATKADYVAILEDAIDFPSLQERLQKRLHAVLHPKTELVPGPVN